MRALSLVDIGDTVGTTTQARGTFQGMWCETFTITSPSLPTGTPVDIAFRLRFDSEINSLGPFDTDNIVRAELLIYGGDVLTLDRASTSGAQSLYDSTVHTYPVGDQVTVEGRMTLTGYTVASSFSSNPVFENGIELLAEGSAGFGIEVITPEAGYSTSSGMTYPTHPVPEPAGFAMATLGLLGLVFCHGRRKR